MPRGDAVVDPYVRLLPYGPIGSKKSLLAYKAAEAGFNVLVLDGDASSHIKHLVSPAARKRLHFISCKDSLQTPWFARTVIKLSSGQPLIWDDTMNWIKAIETPIDPTHQYYALELKKMNKNWVLVLDSITALVTSLNTQFYLETNLDIENPSVKPGFDGYNWSLRWMHLLTTRMKSWPCHVIMTAHEQVVDLTRKVQGKKPGETMAIPTGQQHVQMIGTSKDQARTMGTNFSDVLHHYFVGDKICVSTKPSADHEGKARLVFDDAEWEKMQFKRFADVLGIVPDDNLGDGVKYYEPGELNKQYAIISNAAIAASAPAAFSFNADKLDSKIEIPPLGAAAADGNAPAAMKLDLSGKGK